MEGNGQLVEECFVVGMVISWWGCPCHHWMDGGAWADGRCILLRLQ